MDDFNLIRDDDVTADELEESGPIDQDVDDNFTGIPYDFPDDTPPPDDGLFDSKASPEENDVPAEEEEVPSEEEEVPSEEEEVPPENDAETDDVRYTPAEDSLLGEWKGERGNSLFVPENAEAQRILQTLGLEGIPYSNGEPSFKDVNVAKIFLTQEEMENMRDSAQKRYMADTIADDLNDEDDLDEDAFEEDEDEFSNVQVINWDVVRSVYGDDLDEFIGAIRSGETPKGLVDHHGSKDDEGFYELELIPLAIHESCLHRGGRSKSSTKR